ncbi:hypothetical protein CMO83_01190 [Candidatus Woesearchaeota archaeon]|jgi:hypothetical protein|nr:hypothetical protein [Candidatus Woesearchaeota archaeon]|tara:strand:- start:18010 stop:18768 length:759 start_codon:yes stop_codon:yes gene_type:complete
MGKENYLTTILVVGLVIVAIVLASSSNTSVSSQEEKSKVSVSGSSSVTVDPNKAEVYVNILTLEKTAEQARDENSQISSDVTKALKKEGVKDKDIETSRFTISPRYEYEDVIESGLRRSKQILVGYEVSNVLKVTTQDLEKVGNLIDAAVDNGANDIERVSFGLTDDKEKEVKQQAMILASNDAKEKAVALTANLGVRLVKPLSISESNFFYQPYEISVRSAFLENAVAEDTVINPQKLDVSASVSLVYEIR